MVNQKSELIANAIAAYEKSDLRRNDLAEEKEAAADRSFPRVSESKRTLRPVFTKSMEYASILAPSNLRTIC